MAGGASNGGKLRTGVSQEFETLCLSGRSARMSAIPTSNCQSFNSMRKRRVPICRMAAHPCRRPDRRRGINRGGAPKKR